MANKILYSPSGRAGEYASKGLACNIYNGCVHGCRYCYVPGISRTPREKFHAQSCPAKNDPLERLKQDCQVQHSEPIFFSFNSDLFQPEQGPGLYNTFKAIEIVKESGNNLRILTKGFVDDCFFKRMDAGDEFGVTLTLCFPRDSFDWEPLAVSPTARIDNLRRAKLGGIRTWASFEPVIDPEQTLKLIRWAAPYLDIAKIGVFNHTKSCNWPSDEWKQRVESIDWAEFGRAAIRTCEELGLMYHIKQDLREYLEPVG